jgi:tryptophan synthase alpha chain
MNPEIASTFERLAREDRAALIPYFTAGYPSLEATRQLVSVAAENGADLIEIGIPFSDPVADGATVQRASEAALRNGVTLADCLNLVAQIRREGGKARNTPILFMSYYNPLHRYGIERFAADCASADVNGLIIPDLPPEEAADLQSACKRNNLDIIFLVAPTSTDERLERVAEIASGFIYCVSLTGVTGARTEMGKSVGNLIARARQHTSLPLVVGFGISSPHHVAEVSTMADGAVVGSALIDLIERTPSDEMLVEVAGYIRSLKEATIRGAITAGVS